MTSMASGSYDVSASGSHQEGHRGRPRRRPEDAAASSSSSLRPAVAPRLNRPDNTAFTQQRLPAWQPLLSVGTVLPLFFCLGVAFVALGLGLHFSSEEIQELELDYTGLPSTNCSRCANLTSSNNLGYKTCTCELFFTLPTDFAGPVCLYYQLSNYYQNNRRYSVSRDNLQLSGSSWALWNPAVECQPYQYQKVGRSSLPIAPCGSIANSLFNDTFKLYRQLPGGSWKEVSLDNRGISWWTDTNVKFRNPEIGNKTLAEVFKGTAKPPNWPYPVYDLDKGNPNNTGFVNEHFIVWMRIAALPTFRKLYSRVHQGNASVAMPKGSYHLSITYNYPVLSFHGTKKVIFSTLSWTGGKNPFLGIAYLVFGSTCVLTGVVMMVVHFKYRQVGEED